MNTNIFSIKILTMLLTVCWWMISILFLLTLVITLLCFLQNKATNWLSWFFCGIVFFSTVFILLVKVIIFWGALDTWNGIWLHFCNIPILNPHFKIDLLSILNGGEVFYKLFVELHLPNWLMEPSLEDLPVKHDKDFIHQINKLWAYTSTNTCCSWLFLFLILIWLFYFREIKFSFWLAFIAVIYENLWFALKLLNLSYLGRVDSSIDLQMFSSIYWEALSNQWSIISTFYFWVKLYINPNLVIAFEGIENRSFLFPDHITAISFSLITILYFLLVVLFTRFVLTKIIDNSVMFVNWITSKNKFTGVTRNGPIYALVLKTNTIIATSPVSDYVTFLGHVSAGAAFAGSALSFCFGVVKYVPPATKWIGPKFLAKYQFYQVGSCGVKATNVIAKKIIGSGALASGKYVTPARIQAAVDSVKEDLTIYKNKGGFWSLDVNQVQEGFDLRFKENLEAITEVGVSDQIETLINAPPAVKQWILANSDVFTFIGTDY